MPWSVEDTKKALRMRDNGYSASEIACALGKPSRSSVLGMFWRQGHPARTKLPKQSKRPSAKPKAPPPEAPPMLTPHPPAEPIAPPPPAAAIPAPDHLVGVTTLFCLTEHVCRFPLWGHNETPTEYLFCGQPTAEGPYCPFHFSLTHAAAAPRRRAA